MADQLATKIRLARNEANLSREQLAVALGCSLSTIVRHETGRTQRIGTSRLFLIAKTTGKPIAWFFENDEEDAA